jgi:[ribosomal protein S5]-alanine N-acetyltransferase
MLDVTTAFATFPVLETERLILRAATADDSAPMFRIMADPLVMRYFGRSPMSSLDQAVERIHSINKAFQEQEGVRWVMTLRGQSQFIGTCGFWRLVKEHERAEIGYELASEFWGRGLMPEAVGAALKFGFTTLGLHTVEANIHPDNTSSRRVLEKLGFVQEGYFRENFREPDGRFTDTAIFSLLKTAWLKDSESLRGESPEQIKSL